jgi:formate hydrogenlyase transcriptional activator
MSENKAESDQNLSLERGRYHLLLEITDQLAAAKDLPEVFLEVAPPVLALTGAELLNLSIYDPRRGSMLNYFWKKNRESGHFEAAVDETASGWVWKNQEPIAIPDIECDTRFPAVAALRRQGVRSYTVLPMSTPANRFGALGLGKKIPEAFTQDELEFVSRVAKLGALALEKDAAVRACAEQQSLVTISRELSCTLDTEKLVPAILSSLRSITRYERTILSLLSEDEKTVHRYGEAQEWERYLNNGTTIPLDQSLSMKTVQTRETSFFIAGELLAMRDPLAKAMYEAGVRSVCCVPLIAGNRIWGTLNANSPLDQGFAPSEVEYLQQVANQIAAALLNARSYQEISQLKDRLTQEKRYLEYEIRSANRPDEVVGNSPSLKRVLDYAAIVADTDSTVLITGETGTGKERIARLIHGMSGRKERNFIKLNCAAIPTGLLESELFGHEKGAFTGAVSQKLGRLELADKGTLLLDEIGEIPLELQPKLLRVLQDQEFERLGATKTIKVDVRIIAATNRDLVRAVAEKEFRGDLFYRLHVFPLHIPPLRERRDDIPALIRYFVEKSAARMHKHIDLIPNEAVDAMMNWKWPGNIRELENFIERSVILSEGSRLNAPLAELQQERIREPEDADGTLRDRERQHIISILRQTRGALSGPAGAAARLGLKRTTLQYKMQRLGISRSDYLQ